VLISA